jgi:hypothetical protein
MSNIYFNFDRGLFKQKILTVMKKFILLLLFQLLLIIPLLSQTTSNFVYKLDNGITVKMERDWTHEWIQQRQDPVSGNESTSVTVSVRTMGDLIQSSVFKLTGGGKDVKMKEASPGTYDLKITSKLTGKPGFISFDVKGIVVKPKMKTTVTVTIYNYQINIEETPGANKSLASYETLVNRFKGSTETNVKWGTTSIYAKGAHDKSLKPNESTGDNNGKINPGTYDLVMTIESCGTSQKVWLENFAMKPGINYKITANLNAGELIYVGTQRDVKKLQMYPAGTADRQQGGAKPDKALEISCYEPATTKFPCPPGSYDVLLNISNGSKYEWRKNIIVRTGMRSDVK